MLFNIGFLKNKHTNKQTNLKPHVTLLICLTKDIADVFDHFDQDNNYCNWL